MKQMPPTFGFRPGWKMSALVAIVLPALLALGSWQLARASFKADLQDAWLASIGALPVTAGELMDGSRPSGGFLRVRLIGRYDGERQFLVDNRTHRGVAGYEVVTRFVTDSGSFLVNRGWIAAGVTRSELPRLPLPSEPVTVIGQVWPDMGTPPVFGTDDWGETWPKRVQRLDFHRISELISGAHPLEVRLEAGQPGALIVSRSTGDFGRARHVGYALQWFGLAVVLMVGFIFFGVRAAHDRQRA
jgi:surfeit locus 1 family protein